MRRRSHLPTAWLVSLVLVSALSGCAPISPLIPANDPAFVQSLSKLERTAQTVNGLGATADERAMFLQAESFYRYRFVPPPKNASSYLMQAAAAITDFPVFQSLAGSRELLDLRYRSTDSAVQLWESLLAQHPDTALKSLTLYRLGWAYRSIGVSGMPRDSANAPFDELIATEPMSSLASLAQRARVVPWKSKDAATLRSLVPGLGQLYVGDRGSGWVRMGVAAASLAAIVVSADAERHGDRGTWATRAGGLAGLIVLSFDYASSYEDAVHGVVRWNERAEARFEADNPEAP
jgi:hypothetical protein